MEIRIGEVTHFYSGIHVAVLQLSDEIKSGDMVHILGHTSDFIQRVRSMEIDHRPVQSVGAGKEVALKVLLPVREGDIIYRLTGYDEQEAVIEGPIIIENGL